jgi:hypothetical protein
MPADALLRFVSPYNSDVRFHLVKTGQPLRLPRLPTLLQALPAYAGVFRI